MAYPVSDRTNYETAVELPEGVSATFEHGVLTVKGPKGEVSRKLQSKKTALSVENGEVKLVTNEASKRHKREISTFESHVQNMTRGVTEPHVYKLKVASSHFPITVQQSDGKLVVKNFVGEKKARSLRIPQNVNVKVSGDEIEVTSVDIEAAGNFAGSLEKLCRRPNFDNRIFQDGLYITVKDGEKV